jgi:hypothetical protein
VIAKARTLRNVGIDRIGVKLSSDEEVAFAKHCNFEKRSSICSRLFTCLMSLEARLQCQDTEVMAESLRDIFQSFNIFAHSSHPAVKPTSPLRRCA